MVLSQGNVYCEQELFREYMVVLCLQNTAFNRGSPVVPLVGNICTICTNLIANGTIGKEIGANGKNSNTIGTNGTNVTNQWYHWENPEHTQYNHACYINTFMFSHNISGLEIII